MSKGLITIFIICLVVIPMAIFGCKAKVEQESAEFKTEPTEVTVPMEEVVVTQSPVMESMPSQGISQEAIPPTASLPAATGTARGGTSDQLTRNKDIQTALKAAGFYAGNIDGKIGPKTKKAILEFQNAKGLKADGKVGPKTWTELEKYLIKE